MSKCLFSAPTMNNCKHMRTLQTRWHMIRASFLQVRQHSISTEEPADDSYDRFIQSVCPWQGFSYEKQLELIQIKATYALKKLGNILTCSIPGGRDLYKSRCDEHNGLPCALHNVIPSPVIDYYRNKEHLVIGEGCDGRAEVGFHMTTRKGRDTSVYAYANKAQKPRHFQVQTGLRDFVRASNIPSRGLMLVSGGHWKTLLIRSNECGHMMVSVTLHSVGASQDIINRARESVQEFFLHGEGKHLQVDSLFFQECPRMRCTHDVAPFQLLGGAPHMYESLLGRRFRISPDSFFQVNTPAAEVLYSKVRDLCQLRENTVLLDVCCGTGTIGILFSDSVKKVIGIDEVQQSVADANFNAKLNGVENAKYVCGKAEKMLRDVLKSEISPGDDVVAVVNPGRGGLGKRVTRALRKCDVIRRVVYVSCKPLGRPTFNFVQLCQPTDDEFENDPFTPVSATPVDMFPHTRHYELAVVFER